MTILGIETSCDETAAAIVQDGHILIKQSLATSLDQHKITGGIVPEVAARAQVEYIIPVLQEVLSRTAPGKIDAIAVTVGPGLIGSLLVGVETAKTLAYAWSKPLIPINHMLGHIYGAWLSHDDMDAHWPKLALLVSGGHSELILMQSHQDIKKVGWTLDDAAGEAFDKVAKLLSLEYPGGPNLSKLAESGDPKAVDFPLPLNQKDNFNFSFSGLKTAVLNYTRQYPELSQAQKADIAASFQQTVVTSLINKTKLAAAHFGAQEVILGGGVAANKLLRTELVEKLAPLSCRIPEMAYTTDNAAVIAAAAFYQNYPQDPLTVQADLSLELAN